MRESDGLSHFIAVAPSELVELVCADSGWPDDACGQLRRLAEAIGLFCHLDYHRRLVELKHAYAPFDPDTDDVTVLSIPAEQRQQRLNDLFSDFAWLLEREHFRHLGRDDIEPVLDSASAWGIRMDVDFGVFEHLAIFARGETVQKRRRRKWAWPGQGEEIEVPVYRRLVVILRLRPHPRLRGPVDSDNVYLKIFKDIPKLDVMMLLPGARVRLTHFDRGRIGLPLVTGTLLAIGNVLRDLAGTLEEALASPSTMWGLAVGGLGYGYRSFYGYQQTKQRYHLALTQSLYFQNLDSNAGVLTRLLDEAEEQDSLLGLLAYYCLKRYAEPPGWTAADLDASVELYLDRNADVPFVCQRGAALAQLRKLGLVEESGEQVRALELERAIDAVRSGILARLPGPASAGSAGR
jgi:hypothetical protein